MLNFFKKKTEKQRLEILYSKLMQESYTLSHSNRTASDQKRAEAEEVIKKIEALN